MLAPTVQVRLVRARRLPVHRQPGMAMAWVLGLMAVLGPWIALSVDHRDLVQSKASPTFLIVLLVEVLAFAVLITAGLLNRNRPAAHERLMRLGTFYTTDAGLVAGSVTPVIT